MAVNTDILVVDDDEIFNEMICSFLKIKHARPIAVYSLQQAREYLDKHVPELVILDSNLGDGIGLELMDDIQQTGHIIPVMLITAESDQDLMVKYFEKGVTEYILKPLNFQLMWLKMVLLIENHNLQIRDIEQKKSLHKLLEEREHEEQLARHVYEHMTKDVDADRPLFKALMRSSMTFNGDFLVSARAPNGCIYTLLLDATGHGLAAAISVLPLVSMFRSMVKKSLSLAFIVFELNKKLERETPDDRFVAGILLELDPQQGLLNIWNGGMPDVLLLNHEGQIIARGLSQHMPLGILDEQQFSTQVYSVKIGLIAHLLMFSDGLIEQDDAQGECFGMQGVYDSIDNSAQPTDVIKTLERDFDTFLGSAEQVDDISVCHIDIIALLSAQGREAIRNSNKDLKAGSTQLNISVVGQQLSIFDLPGSIDNLMKMADIPVMLRQRTFTICCELFCNALDHGVLGLDSAIKNEDNGFMRFFEEKQLRMANLSPLDKIDLRFEYDLAEQEIRLTMTDSGAGFTSNNKIASPEQLAGRGLTLIRQLSQEVQIQPPGNSTSVVIN